MLFYSSCKVMFYNKNLLHSEIVTVPSDFRMLISQQSSTTLVQPAESINMKTEVFFMRELRNTKIILEEMKDILSLVHNRFLETCWHLQSYRHSKTYLVPASCL